MFIRTVLYLLAAIFLLTFLRYVIGAILRAFAELFQPRGPASGTGREGAARSTAGGELKKDPVCGTYVAAGASVVETIGGEVLHFCSTKCRDQYTKPEER